MQSRRPSRFGGFAICVPRPAVRRQKFHSTKLRSARRIAANIAKLAD